MLLADLHTFHMTCSDLTRARLEETACYMYINWKTVNVVISAGRNS